MALTLGVITMNTELLKSIEIIKKVAMMKNCPWRYRIAAKLFKFMGY